MGIIGGRGVRGESLGVGGLGGEQGRRALVDALANEEADHHE
jgi:hypothetical protein